jgi:hypothetical protein
MTLSTITGRRRIGALVAAAAVTLTACGGAAAPNDDAGDPPSSTSGPEAAGPVAAIGVLPEGSSALADMNAADFPPPLVDPGEIRSGGPPPDGITPIEDPVFLDVIDALDRFDPAEAVVSLEINGDARAYPVQVMILHEIVNDTAGGVPVSITYCPLCNSAVSYRREIRGVETTFGTSGRLYNSALVMYDRATESLWTHYDGRAVVGVLAGEQLESIPSPLMSWDQFRTEYPDGLVLDPDEVNLGRHYGGNPYAGYDDPESFPFLFRGEFDDRADAMQRVVGVTVGGDATAFTLDAVSGEEVTATNDTVGDREIVVFWAPGQASAVEARGISDGRDVGTVGVFSRVVGDETLTFRAEGEAFVDEETGSVWRLTGEAAEGPLAGSRLARVNHLDTFWFAWSSYHEGTDLVTEP